MQPKREEKDGLRESVFRAIQGGMDVSFSTFSNFNIRKFPAGLHVADQVQHYKVPQYIQAVTQAKMEGKHWLADQEGHHHKFRSYEQCVSVLLAQVYYDNIEIVAAVLNGEPSLPSPVHLHQ